MKELFEYDSLSANYLVTPNLNSSPLMSFDFHLLNVMKISKDMLDIQAINEIKKSLKWNFNADFEKEFEQDTVILITTPKLEIVFSSQNIVKMNGYKSEEVLGKTPRMFQGEATCKVASSEIRTAIQEQVPFDKWVLNYKKNGEIYNCHIKGFPIFDTKGKLCNFIAFEKAA